MRMTAPATAAAYAMWIGKGRMGDCHAAFVSSGQWDYIEDMTYEERLKKAHEFFGIEEEENDDILVTVVDCHS